MSACGGLLGLTVEQAAGLLEGQHQPWILKHCSAPRPRPSGCVERVVRTRELEDGTIEVTASGFLDVPQGGKRAASGKEQTGTES